MDIGITECYICNGLVSASSSYDPAFRQHEAWHIGHDNVLDELRREIEELKRRFGDLEH